MHVFKDAQKNGLPYSIWRKEQMASYVHTKYRTIFPKYWFVYITKVSKLHVMLESISEVFCGNIRHILGLILHFAKLKTNNFSPKKMCIDILH